MKCGYAQQHLISMLQRADLSRQDKSAIRFALLHLNKVKKDAVCPSCGQRKKHDDQQ